MHVTPIAQHLEKLPAFVMVVRLGSITKAAKALSISQAALSQSMKALEDALDTPLLVRARTGVKLTEEGQPLFRYGEQLVGDLDLLDARIRNPQNQPVRRIRIGTHEALAIHLLPQQVESFQKENPNYFLSIVSGRVDALVQQVLEKTIDFIITVKPKAVDGLTSTVLYKETMQFYGPSNSKKLVAGHKLEVNGVKKSLLSKIPILTDSQAHLSNDRPLSRILAELGLPSAHYFQLNSFEASLRLASKGLGIALLPSQIGDSEPRKVRRINITNLDNKAFDHGIYCSYLAQADSAFDLGIFVDHVKKQR